MDSLHIHTASQEFKTTTRFYVFVLATAFGLSLVLMSFNLYDAPPLKIKGDFPPLLIAGFGSLLVQLWTGYVLYYRCLRGPAPVKESEKWQRYHRALKRFLVITAPALPLFTGLHVLTGRFLFLGFVFMAISSILGRAPWSYRNRAEAGLT